MGGKQASIFLLFIPLLSQLSLLLLFYFLNLILTHSGGGGPDRPTKLLYFGAENRFHGLRRAPSLISNETHAFSST